MRTKKPLTPLQSAVLTWMVEEVSLNLQVPTLREIAERFGLGAHQSAISVINALEAKGEVRRTSRKGGSGRSTIRFPNYRFAAFRINQPVA